MRTVAITLLVTMTGCATSTPHAPAPVELGNRIRVRIASRGDSPSITTAGYRLRFVVRCPDGRLEAFGVHCTETTESEFAVGSIDEKVRSLCDLPNGEAAESLHGDRDLCHDAILPPGYTLSFAPGHHYAYRVVASGSPLVADLAPEIRVGQITADGSRYVELTPSDGPPLSGDQDPPNWPPAGVR